MLPTHECNVIRRYCACLILRENCCSTHSAHCDCIVMQSRGFDRIMQGFLRPNVTTAVSLDAGNFMMLPPAGCPQFFVLG